MTQTSKPRALTYTEMMNGGRQQLEQEEHMREQELQQKLNELQCDVNHRPLRQQGSSAVVHAPMQDQDETEAETSSAVQAEPDAT